MTKIIKCICKNKGQDRLHGNNMRVANKTMGRVTDTTITVRCTVCLAEHSVNKK